MVKINYKDFVLEFETVDEARYFIERSGTNVPKKTERVELLPPVPKKRSKQKGAMHNRWLPEEVHEIVSGLKIGIDTSKILRIPILRQHHSKGAIRGMIWRVKSNAPSNREVLAPVLTAIINDYHANK